MDGGRIGSRGLLSEEAIRRGLAPGRRFGLPCGFRDIELTYGQHWMVYFPKNRTTTPPATFGHGGSDGTQAWVWPDRDLMVLLFTQSRATTVLADFESALQHLLLDQDLDGYRRLQSARRPGVAHPAELEGLYWDEDIERAYYLIRKADDRLAIERPGRFRFTLLPADSPLTFTAEGAPNMRISFEEVAGGPSPAFLLKTPTRQERQLRHRAAADLPNVSTVLEMVRRAHGLDQLPKSGAVRLSGRFENPQRNQKGRIEQLFDARRSRTEFDFGEFKIVYLTDGDRAWLQRLAGGPYETLDGVALEQALLDHPLVVFGNWKPRYSSIEVLRRIGGSESPRLVVRAVPAVAAGSSKIIDPTSGQLVGEDRLEWLPGMGVVGVEIAYEDFRTVAGITLPMRQVSKYASRLVGEFAWTVESFEVGVSADDALRLPESPNSP